ncbi:phosphopantetheine-binding protein [Priestia koreensis]|uniref:phosphopantetheine-binding protein n=1 Tax=Priestia koreensis TaxID=284581 RepID=UPI003D00123C
MKASVIELLQKQIKIDESVDNDADLFFLGLNSISFMHFIVDLESHYEVEVLDEELSAKNFATVNKILEFINLKKEGVGI